MDSSNRIYSYFDFTWKILRVPSLVFSLVLILFSLIAPINTAAQESVRAEVVFRVACNDFNNRDCDNPNGPEFAGSCTLDGAGGVIAYCGNVPEGYPKLDSGKEYYRLTNCDQSTCETETARFTQCNRAAFNICQQRAEITAVESGGSSIRLSDGTWSCDVTDNGSDGDTFRLSVSGCTNNGQDARNQTRCIAYKTTRSNNAVLNCDPIDLLLASGEGEIKEGENISEIVAYDGGNCFAFRTTNNGTKCIQKSIVQEACGTNGFLGINFSLKKPINSYGEDFRLCKTNSFEEWKATNPALSNVAANITQVRFAVNSFNVDECRDIDDAFLANPPEGRTFTEADKGKKYCSGQVLTQNADGTFTDSQGNEYNSEGALVTESETVKDNSNDLIDTLWKLVMSFVAIVFYVLSLIAFMVLFLIAWLVLFLLSINPAGQDFITAIEPMWGAVLSIANLFILGAFLYVGLAYLLNLEYIKKNIGEFLMKIVYYAVLLQFTLLGTAAVINIGYGVGNLMKWAYAGSTSSEAINQKLAGNFISSIGNISYIRCGKTLQDCKPSTVGNREDVGIVAKGQNDFANITELFGSDPATVTSAAVAEGTALVMAGFAIWIFFKTLKVVLLRLVGLIFLMALSPIGLASYFSPVESWQSIGKQMVDKFIKYVAFYPAFIMALIMVNTLSSTITGIIRRDVGTTATTAGAATTPAAGEGARAFLGFVNIYAQDAGGSFQAGLTNALFIVLGAGIAMGALYVVDDYFIKEFDTDLGTIGKGIADTAGSVKSGLSGVFKTAGKGIRAGGLLASGTGKVLKGLDSATANKLSNLQGKAGMGAFLQRQALRAARAGTWTGAKVGEGVGSGIDNFGRTVQFVPRNLSRLGENVKGFFDKIEKADEAQNDTWWDTQINLALKDVGVASDYADALTPAASSRALEKENIKAIQEKARAEGKEDPIMLQTRDKIRDERRAAMGLKDDTIRQDDARVIMDQLIRKAKGDISNLNGGQRHSLERLIDQSSTDKALASQIFDDPAAIGLAQQMDARRLISSETIEKLSNTRGDLLGDQKRRKNFGAVLAANPFLFDNIDRAVFKDDAVLQGFKDGGGTDEMLDKKRGGLNVYQKNEIAQIRDQSSQLRASLEKVGEKNVDTLGHQMRMANGIDSYGFQAAAAINESVLEYVGSTEYENASEAERRVEMTERFNTAVKADIGDGLYQIIDNVDGKILAAGNDDSKRQIAYESIRLELAQNVDSIPIEELLKGRLGKGIKAGLSKEDEKLLVKKGVTGDQRARQLELQRAVRDEAIVRAEKVFRDRNQVIDKTYSAAVTVSDALDPVKKYETVLKDNSTKGAKAIGNLIKDNADASFATITAIASDQFEYSTDLETAGVSLEHFAETKESLQKVGTAMIAKKLTETVKFKQDLGERKAIFGKIVDGNFWVDEHGLPLAYDEIETQAAELAKKLNVLATGSVAERQVELDAIEKFRLKKVAITDNPRYNDKEKQTRLLKLKEESIRDHEFDYVNMQEAKQITDTLAAIAADQVSTYGLTKNNANLISQINAFGDSYKQHFFGLVKEAKDQGSFVQPS